VLCAHFFGTAMPTIRNNLSVNNFELFSVCGQSKKSKKRARSNERECRYDCICICICIFWFLLTAHGIGDWGFRTGDWGPRIGDEEWGWVSTALWFIRAHSTLRCISLICPFSAASRGAAQKYLPTLGDRLWGSDPDPRPYLTNCQKY